MAWVKIVTGAVVQKQADPAEGFIQAPDSVVCGQLFDGVNYIDPPPTPASTEQNLLAAIKANNRGKAIITAIQTSDDVQLIAAIAARYPALAGDALKAVTDIVLVLARQIRT